MNGPLFSKWENYPLDKSLRKAVKEDQKLPLTPSRIRGTHVEGDLPQFGSLKAVWSPTFLAL